MLIVYKRNDSSTYFIWDDESHEMAKINGSFYYMCIDNIITKFISGRWSQIMWSPHGDKWLKEQNVSVHATFAGVKEMKEHYVEYFI